MKIAVISDTHGNLINLKAALREINREEVDRIIHCGDVGGAEVLDFFKDFKGEVFAVLGNMDKGYFSEKDFKTGRFLNVKFCCSPDSIGDEYGELKFDDKKIAFVHLPEIARKLAQSQKYDLVFYGHTHQPYQEKIGKTILINPGNLAGLFYRASFAIYDLKTNNLELKIL